MTTSVHGSVHGSVPGAVHDPDAPTTTRPRAGRTLLPVLLLVAVVGALLVWVAEPVRIPRQSEALYLLQRIRDEAHRFAIQYHRTLRNKRMTRSSLDGIAGLGPTRRKRLVKELGGVNAVKRASLDELTALSWLPDQVAQAVYTTLHEPSRPNRT